MFVWAPRKCKKFWLLFSLIFFLGFGRLFGLFVRYFGALGYFLGVCMSFWESVDFILWPLVFNFFGMKRRNFLGLKTLFCTSWRDLLWVARRHLLVWSLHVKLKMSFQDHKTMSFYLKLTSSDFRPKNDVLDLEPQNTVFRSKKICFFLLITL